MRRTMLAAAAMTTLGALPVYLLSAQAVLVRDDLGFDEADLGLAVSVFFAAGAAVSLTAGALTDRLGRRTSTLIAGGLALASTAGLAAATVSFWALLVFLALAGIANAALQITANATIASAVPPRRRGLAFALKQCAVPTSILLGGVAVPTVGLLVGWRWTFAATAVGAALVVARGLRLPRGRTSVAAQASTGQRPLAAALVVTAVGMTLASAACTALGAFFPAWAFETGLSPGRTGLLLIAVSGLSIVARILAGLAADRRRGHHLPRVALHLVVGSGGLILLSFGSPAMLVVGAVLAYAIGWSWPGLLLYAVVLVGRDRPATASSTVQLGAFLGGASGPLLFGLLASGAGYPAAWRISAVTLLLAAAMMMLARHMFLADLERRPLPGSRAVPGPMEA